jgi:hypothetical protein
MGSYHMQLIISLPQIAPETTVRTQFSLIAEEWASGGNHVKEREMT